MKAPNKCPSCSGEVGTYLTETFCTRARNYHNDGIICKEALAGQIEYFTTVLGIKGVAKLTAMELVERLQLKSLYHFLQNIDSFEAVIGENGNKIRNEIISKIGEVTLLQVIISLGIRRVGNHAVELLFENNFNIYDILNDEFGAYNYTPMLNISGIGETIVEEIRFYFQDDIRRQEALAIVDFFEPKKKEIKKVENSPIQGYSVVITGTYNGMERTEFKNLLKSHGATLKTSVSGKTDLLVVGDNPGSAKIKQAKDKGVKMMSNEEFEKLIGDK